MPLFDSSRQTPHSAGSATANSGREPEPLAVYGALSRTFALGYRSKIMLVAFVGTHVPLITLLVWLLYESELGRDNKLAVILVALAATLIGTALTLLLLHHLLQPIVITSRSLRDYLSRQRLPVLPRQFTDDVGLLMRDVDHTLHKLDSIIRELTYYNRETGLPNRTHFLAAIARRMHRQQVSLTTHNDDLAGLSEPDPAFAICLVELVNFRQLVGSLGLEKTTSLLRHAGQELEHSLDHRGQLSRISDRALGFVLDTGSAQVLANRLARLLGVLAEACDGHEVQPQYSAGAVRHPIDGGDAGELFDNAQLALSEAVETPGSLTLYSPQSRSMMQERIRLEHELAQAVELDQLRLYYQPVIDSIEGRVIGAEALLRWMHPERGMQMPDEFIPLAERTDLIHAIGRWTLNEAGRQIRYWRDRHRLPGRIAVNLSARQFSDPDLPRYVNEVLETHGIDGCDLELEVTETSAMIDPRRSGAVLSAVQALGVSVAIDDFGTGYSSMSYLRNLPFDRLKIDRQFVQQLAIRPERLTICRALITLAEGLGMKVLAEGVEFAADVAALESLGCTRFQGFHYSEAVQPDEFEDLLGRRWNQIGQLDELTSA